MGGPRDAAAPPLRLVWGDDEFAVQRQGRLIFEEWARQEPGAESEIIDAVAANSEEALRALRRLREALQTLPFFGSTKSVWFRDCNFAGEDRVSEAQAVVQGLTDLVRELAAFPWKDVRLLITARKVDRRRGFFKTLDKLADSQVAGIEQFDGLSLDDRDWRLKAEALAAGEFRALGRKPSADALTQFVDHVGPNSRQISSEAQKLVAYVGDRPEITAADADAVVTRGRHARAFALGDAVGDRQLARALRHLDDELWAMQSDKKRNEIGLLYGLISKVRAMLLAREMIEEGLIRPSREYPAFAAQLKRLSPDQFPDDKRYNPLAINAYVLFRAAQQAAHFSRDELVAAMEELLRCNRRLVGSGLDGGMVLQMAITRILTREPAVGGTGQAGEPASRSTSSLNRERPGPAPLARRRQVG